jgi:mannose-1-phosphate guanylyltransferase
MLCALIMAGGQGTRFWPLSTEKKPKQFLNLLGDQTMLQMTTNRINEIVPFDRIFVCTTSDYIGLVKQQLSNLPEENIIIEPEGRNTAPCIMLSSMLINKKFKDINMIVLPSDHLIQDEEEFVKAVLKCEEFLDKEKKALVTIGMKPDRAETGYGYIKYNKILDSKEIQKVDEFIEKPDKYVAEYYLKDGNYLWNSGIFLWNITNIINQIKIYCPSIYENLKDIQCLNGEKLNEYIKEKYSNIQKISIDYAVLEKSKDIYVKSAEMGWDDIGSWNALERYKEKDMYSNIVNDNTRLIESQSNIALNNDKKLIMIGINDTVAIETEDSIYIVNKQYMNNLKKYKEDI